MRVWILTPVAPNENLLRDRSKPFQIQDATTTGHHEIHLRRTGEDD